MANDQFPVSVEEAKQHIHRIRSDKGLGDGPNQIGNNASDLESALRILSDDLYQTATHFLLGLIQNADDNTYSAREPTISIPYSPNQVRIDCNEDGFTFKNVEAICRICMSTKSGRSKSSGFVGEKGIGFKAVFKAASTVWIKSGHYSFKFDRDAHLGMIAPIWHAFPGRTKKGWTSLLLDLSDDCDRAAIIHELKSYDSRILLFLRRLRKLVIKVDLGTFMSGGFTRTLGRGDWPSANPAMMTLRTNRKENDYFVWKKTVNNLPNEGRRQGITSSEVVLALPLTSDKTEPLLVAQNVYAFLPIRDCGFKFLLQADFLLPATREDITGDSAWNKALMSAAASAYVDAMVHMANLHTKLRYTMLRFIPIQASQSPPFEEFRKKVLELLRKVSLLETHSSNLRIPNTVIVIPKEFCDNTGQPLLLLDDNKDKFLSARYEDRDRAAIMELGGQVMIQQTFVDQTKLILSRNPASFFKDKDKSWHASFCQSITSLSSNNRVSLAIIPVRTGEWVTADNSPIFFPKDYGADSTIPEGINIRVVNHEAANDPNRRNLFALMGVREYHNSDISNIIANNHQSLHCKPAELSSEVLISHAVFLFKSKWENKSNVNLWMSAENGCPRQAFSMYMPSDEPSSANKILPNGGNYGILHQDYFQQSFQDEQAWNRFLRIQLKVPVYPRILAVEPILQTNSNSIHADFQCMMNGMLTEQCLVVLRDGWEYYKAYLDLSSPEAKILGLAIYQQGLINNLRAMPTKCIGLPGTKPIRNTFVPLPEMVKSGKGLAPLLSIPEPQDPNWTQLLQCLDVGLKANIKFYLECLRGASKLSSVEADMLRGLMQKIELEGASDLTLLRAAFNTEMLIHIPPKTKTSASKWMTTENCFWRGEAWLQHSIGLQAYYPDNEILFRHYLMVPDAGIEHIVREAESIRPGRKTSHIARIFSALSHCLLYRELTAEQKNRLRSHAMFPIVTKPENEPYEFLATADDVKPWLIADRAVFWTNFQYILPVLSLKVDTVLKIQNLLDALDLGDRLLSKVATSVTEVHGDVEPSDELTERYRSRKDYLFRLIPKVQFVKEPMIQNICNVEVHLASKIVQYWRAPVGLRQVQSTLSEGAAFIECDYRGQLRIYLRKGYESETNACELADQFRQFFNIPIKDRDLLNLVLTDTTERIDELFEKRGIPPLFEDVVEDDEYEDEDVDDFDPREESKPSLENGSASRFSRLLRRMRFQPAATSTSQTHEYPIQEQGISQPSAIQASTLSTIRSTMMQLEFSQNQGCIRGTGPELSFLDKLKGIAQFDSDMGEMIVSDILEQVLGNQYEPEGVWEKGRNRSSATAPFVFTDYQGRFTALLSRLSGNGGRTQGHGNIIYHIDVKTTRGSSPSKIHLSKEELERARQYSIIQSPDAEFSRTPFKNVAILAYISSVRKNPSIIFLTDPWDLLNDGQLYIDRWSGCRLSLNLKPEWRLQSKLASGETTGLDVVQFKPVAGPLGNSR